MWTPPADERVEDTGWQPPADERIGDSDSSTNPNDMNAGLNRTADLITAGLNRVNNLGRAEPILPPGTNLMQPQGDQLFSKAGGNVAEYLGSKFPTHPYAAAAVGTAVSMANPQNWLTPGMEGRTPIPGAEGFKQSAEEAGAKSLGFTKRFLNKPGNIDTAREVAQTMLDEGVITNPIRHPLSSGAEDMLGRAEALGNQSGKAIESSINQIGSTGKTSFGAWDAISEIESQLRPKRTGGAYDAEHAVVNEIIDTVKAHGEGPLDFQSAQELKEKLQDLGKFNQVTDATKANLYRRASGIVRDALDRSVAGAATEHVLPVVQPGSKTGEPHALFAYNDKWGPGGADRSVYNVFGDPNHPAIQSRGFGSSVTKADLDTAGIPVTGREPTSAKYNPIDKVGSPDPAMRQAAIDYFVNKKLYGNSDIAQKALTNRLSSEQGNKAIGLTDTIAAVPEIAEGNLGKLGAVLGVKRLLERYYHATKATTADALAKSTLGPEAKRTAIISAYVVGRNNR